MRAETGYMPGPKPMTSMYPGHRSPLIVSCAPFLRPPWNSARKTACVRVHRLPLKKPALEQYCTDATSKRILISPSEWSYYGWPQRSRIVRKRHRS